MKEKSPRTTSNARRNYAITGVVAATLTLGIAFASIGAESLVRGEAQGRCFTDAARLPACNVGVVLGTNPLLVGGYANPYFETRLNAAAALFRAGKVRYLLVSGDNGTRGYDEPTAMRQGLIARGIPADRIVCDYAGFRTLDSIIRTDKVFGQKRFTVVSQHFHNERALYIAQNAGLEAYGFDAADPHIPRLAAAKMWWRERFARITAILDATVWQRKPRFLGEPVRIGPATG